MTDGPGNYQLNERCTIEVLASGQLSSVGIFDTESNYDYLTINGHRYQGSSGPSSVAVDAGSSFTWRSDTSTTGAGWTLCLTPYGDSLPIPSPLFSLSFCWGRVLGLSPSDYVYRGRSVGLYAEPEPRAVDLLFAARHRSGRGASCGHH